MPTNNQEEDNYVIQQLPKHSVLHTMGGWVGALSAHLGDCTLRPSWPPWITHGTNQCIFLIWELQLIGAVQHRPLKPFWLENMHSFYGQL